MSVPTSDPTSHNITGPASTVGNWICPVHAKLLSVTNNGTALASLTVDGSAPTNEGPNEFEVGTGQTIQVSVRTGDVVGLPAGYTGPVVQAISTAALDVYVEVLE